MLSQITDDLNSSCVAIYMAVADNSKVTVV